ncbi:hypothetical protein MNBD_GAMMA22-609 [hydrothermal vent metagenome]|uniref:Uncharacterized protein n=1 Tax=hydrothermal vent metagenome TaxID=652676 RepID=A0A3B1A0E4_9ZZZZ
MIPKPIYEVLPIIYVVGGILAMTTVQSMTSFISGLAIGIAGLIILALRRKYRSTHTNRLHQKNLSF